MEYLLTVGLEIHLKLNSQTKIFCRCRNEQNFEVQANTHICPVCTGQPGALPLLSQEVVEKAIVFGRLLNAEIQPFSAFDRKNYFYPDLPMGFQITQFYHPIIKNGTVKYRISAYEEEKAVHIHEAHLECDTAKMIHADGKSLLDFNRAGTPLLEIVTDPEFSSAEEVVEFAKEMQRIARWNHLGDADLEKGQMRVDVNVSLRKHPEDALGTKVELKNINSFGAMKRAIEREYQRQQVILER
jgi:aspartyl-tRNA(Asn)/glutamyl-tRNA(Gln) amidotransferase subunit B